jgi:hypothetical protein
VAPLLLLVPTPRRLGQLHRRQSECATVRARPLASGTRCRPHGARRRRDTPCALHAVHRSVSVTTLSAAEFDRKYDQPQVPVVLQVRPGSPRHSVHHAVSKRATCNVQQSAPCVAACSRSAPVGFGSGLVRNAHPPRRHAKACVYISHGVRRMVHGGMGWDAVCFALHAVSPPLRTWDRCGATLR